MGWDPKEVAALQNKVVSFDDHWLTPEQKLEQFVTNMTNQAGQYFNDVSLNQRLQLVLAVFGYGYCLLVMALAASFQKIGELTPSLYKRVKGHGGLIDPPVDSKLNFGDELKKKKQ